MLCRCVMAEKVHKRRSISGDGESVQISLRLSSGLLGRIEAACRDDPSFTSRAHFIDASIHNFLNTIPCPKCGKRINKDSKVCSFCETRINDYDERRAELERSLEDSNNYVITAHEYLEKIIDLEKDFQNHVKERPQEERDFISKSPELILIQAGVRQTRDMTKAYLGIIEKYNNLSIEELRRIRYEEDIVISELKKTGVSVNGISRETEREILEYVWIKKKYDENRHLDNVSIPDLEFDIRALETFGLSVGKIAQKIEMNYNSFKFVDSFLSVAGTPATQQ